MNKKKTGAIILCLIIGWLATLSTDWQSALLGRTVMGLVWPYHHGRPYGSPSGIYDCLQSASKPG